MGGCGWRDWFHFSPFLRHTLRCCPASGPVPQGPSAPPRPLVHQLCSPYGAPIRGNSHSTFLLFAVLDASGSWCSFRVVRLPTGSSCLGTAVSPSPAAALCWAFCLPPGEQVGPAGLCLQGLSARSSVPSASGVIARVQPGH